MYPLNFDSIVVRYNLVALSRSIGGSGSRLGQGFVGQGEVGPGIKFNNELAPSTEKF